MSAIIIFNVRRKRVIIILRFLDKVCSKMLRAAFQLEVSVAAMFLGLCCPLLMNVVTARNIDESSSFRIVSFLILGRGYALTLPILPTLPE